MPGRITLDEALASTQPDPTAARISGQRTWDGYPAVDNGDGTFSTRITATVTDERLNGGAPTNIPTLWKGEKLEEEQAIENAVASGISFPKFDDIPSAVAEAKRISESIKPPSRRITFDEATKALDATETTLPQGFGVSRGIEGYEVAKPGGRGTPATFVKKPVPADRSRFSTALKADLPIDEQTRLKVLANDLFPNDPAGIQKVGFRNGRPVFVNADGQLQYVTGRGTGLAASVVANGPEILLSTAGALSPSPVAGSAAGGAAGRLIKRGISNAIFDEPVTAGSLGKEVAIEAAISGAGALAGKTTGAVLDSGRNLRLSNARVLAGERQRELIRRQTGIELDLAQATGDRRLIALRDYAGRYPGESAELIQAQDELLSGQFDAAVNRTLNLVAQPTSAFRAGQTGINAAEELIEGAKVAVQQQVKPLYEAAYQAVPEVTDPNILKFIKLPYFNQALRAGRKIQALDARVEATPEFLNSTSYSLKDLDYLKRGLDQQYKSLAGQQGKGNEARALLDAKKEFVAELDNFSNQLYQQARSAYQQGIQQTVEPLESGLVGTLAKMDPQQANIAAKLFTSSRASPESVALLKASLERFNPDAYKGLVRSYLDDAYSNARTLTQGGDLVNVPGKFVNQLAPNPSDRDLLKAILPAGALPTFEALLDAGQKLARTPLGASRVAGSNTLRDQTVSEVLKGRGRAVLKALTTSRETIRDAADFQLQEQAIIKVTEALIDPAKRAQLSAIVKMSDESRKLILLGGLLSGESGAGYVSDRGENAGLQ